MSDIRPEDITEDLEEPAEEEAAHADSKPASGSEPDDESIDPESPAYDESAEQSQMVPVWLAILVLVLLLAVMAVGGFVIRGAFDRTSKANSAAEMDIAKWEDAVKLNADDLEAHLNLGFAYQQAERFEDALDQYDFVIERAPSDTAALYNRGVVLQALGRDDEAEETWWDVLEVDAEHVLAAKSLGEYYASRREYRSLIEAVRPVVEANESAADLQYLMGLAYENLGNLDWARARYELALKYYPDMPEAREGLDRLGVSR